MDGLLSRYDEKQREVINNYWELIRWTRKHGKIADKIKAAEMDFWSKFETDIVVSALQTHMEKYPKIKENYTRGIMRNKAEQKALGMSGEMAGASKKTHQRPNKFRNYSTERDLDWEAIEYLGMLRQMGQLEAKREELKKDPRYAEILGR